MSDESGLRGELSLTGLEPAPILRAKILAWRKCQSRPLTASVSQAISLRFLAHTRILPRVRGLKVCLFKALPGEIDLSLEIAAALHVAGALLHYPRVVDRTKSQLEMVGVREFPVTRWERGAYGIDEPPGDWAIADPALLDVIFVPGLAYGCSGARIGMGSGYFDRYLIKAPQALRVALTRDAELFPRLEQKPWDQAVDWIFTETREIPVFRTTALSSRFGAPE